MKRMFKKLAAFTLAALLSVQLLPAAAFAVDEKAAAVAAAQAETAIRASAAGTGPVGTLLADTVDAAIAKQQVLTAADDGITGLAIEGGSAHVTYHATVPALITVAVYDDKTGAMLTSAMTEAETSEEDTTLTLALSDVPAYYTATAYLLDAETYQPLCDRYTDALHTEAMQALENATVASFDPEYVLNLDDDETTNFVVFREGTHVVDYVSGANEVTELGGGRYRIDHADAELRALDEGETLALEGPDGMVLLLVVKSISVSGDSVTIEEDTVSELSDVFEAVKIEGGLRPGEAPEDEAGLMADPENDIEDGITGIISKDFSLVNIPLAGSGEGAGVTLSAGGTAKLLAYVKVYLTKDEQYAEAVITLYGRIDVSLSGRTGRFSLDLFPETLGFSPVPGVYLSVMPALVFEAEGAFRLNAEFEAAVGGAYTGEQFENRSEKPQFKKPHITAEGEVFAGFSLTPQAKVLSDKIGAIKLTGQFGFTGDFTMEKDPTDKRHACEKCVSGELALRLEASASAKFLNFLDVPVKVLIQKTFKRSDYYYSFDYGDFAFSTCPHQKCLVNLSVYDPDGSMKANAVVNVSGENELKKPVSKTLTADVLGKAEVYLPKGEYSFTCTDSAKDASAVETVTLEADKHVRLDLKEKTYPVTVTVVNQHGEPVAGAVIAGAGKVGNPTTGESGKAVFTEPNGAYTFKISKNGGEPVYAECTVAGGPVELHVVLPEQEYTVTVHTVDRDGKPVSGAVVTVEELEASHTSGASGLAVFAAKNGTYTLSAVSADGEMTGKGSVTVQNGEAVTTVVLTPELAVVSVMLYAPDGSVVPHTEIGGTGLAAAPMTDLDGLAVFEIEKGSYTFRVSTDESYADEAVEITGDTRLTIRLQPRELHWSFDESTGALKVWGKGPMQDFENYDKTPWTDVRDKVRSVELEELSTVGSHAFESAGITGISIPEGVTAIGASAFYACKKLKSVTLPESMESIGQQAFAGCTALGGITFPETLKEIGGAAFQGCTGLKSVTIPSGVKSLGSSAFYQCSGLTSAVVGCREIGSAAFWQCTALKSVTLGDKVELIGPSAFRECAISAIDFPDSVTEIDDYAFMQTPLGRATFGRNVASIGRSAFETTRGSYWMLFTGDAPPALGYEAFSTWSRGRGSAYYPKSWGEPPTGNYASIYGGSISWIAYDPAEGLPG